MFLPLAAVTLSLAISWCGLGLFRTVVPAAKRRFELAPQELFVQHQHQAGSRAGNAFKKPDVATWMVSIAAWRETCPR